MRVAIAVALLTLITPSIYAQDALEKIKVAAENRIKDRNYKDRSEKLQKKLVEQIDQRMVDTGREWNACAVDLAKDWLVDRRAKLSWGDADMWDEAASMFLLLHSRGVRPSPDIMGEIEKNIDDILVMMDRR